MNKVKNIMKNLILFFKVQYKLLGLLILIAPVPLYFFLILLFALKLLAFQSMPTSKNIMEKAALSLENQLKRKPSKQLIINRAQFIHTSRDVALAIAGVGVIFISIFFKAF
jgi:hypothetical protein